MLQKFIYSNRLLLSYSLIATRSELVYLKVVIQCSDTSTLHCIAYAHFMTAQIRTPAVPGQNGDESMVKQLKCCGMAVEI